MLSEHQGSVARIAGGTLEGNGVERSALTPTIRVNLIPRSFEVADWGPTCASVLLAMKLVRGVTERVGGVFESGLVLSSGFEKLAEISRVHELIGAANSGCQGSAIRGVKPQGAPVHMVTGSVPI